MPSRVHPPVHPIRVALVAIAALLLVVPAAAVPVSATSGAAVRIGNALDPAELRIRPGTAVRWVNADDERHRMRSQSGPTRFDNGNLEPGESFTVTFGREGTWSYFDERDDDDSSYWGRIVVASGADDGGDDSSADPAASLGAAPAAPEAILMAGRAFSPAGVTVDAARPCDGATTTIASTPWRPATARSTRGSWTRGQTFSTRLDAPGTYAYLCALHPEMTGSIEVIAGATGAAPAPTPAATPGPSPASPTPTSSMRRTRRS